MGNDSNEYGGKQDLGATVGYISIVLNANHS